MTGIVFDWLPGPPFAAPKRDAVSATEVTYTEAPFGSLERR